MYQVIYTTAPQSQVNWADFALENHPMNAVIRTLSEVNVTLGHIISTKSHWISGSTNKWDLEIDILGNNAYTLKKPIPIIISMDGDDYIAQFTEAEIVTSCETAAEALRWLKATIIDTFEQFKSEEKILGPLPRKQLKVLEAYLAKKSARKS
jgi:hypothetical protein